MSRARSLAALALSGALAVPLVGTASPAASTALPVGATAVQASPVVAAAPRVRQRGKLKVYPQIAQPGKGTKRPGKAKVAMAAKFRPVRTDRRVVLQRRTSDGWVKVTTRRTNGRGIAEFTARATRKREPVKYRAVAKRYDDLGKKRTKAKLSDAWGSPELSDTFSGRTLPDHWNLRPQTREGFRKCSMSSNRAVKVRDGRLRLSVRKDKSREGDRKCRTEHGKFDWRWVGHVGTQGQRSFGYGVAAARIKFQKRRGQHGAFWMQPVEQSGSNPEVDVVEWFGTDRGGDKLTSFVHFTDDDGTRKKSGPRGVVRGGQLFQNPGRFGNKWWGKYHVFSVEWTPKKYIFRIDGQETLRTNKGRSAAERFLILSLQANTYEIPYLDGDPRAPHSIRRLAQHMHIDWVRYWER